MYCNFYFTTFVVFCFTFLLIVIESSGVCNGSASSKPHEPQHTFSVSFTSLFFTVTDLNVFIFSFQSIWISSEVEHKKTEDAESAKLFTHSIMH